MVGSNPNNHHYAIDAAKLVEKCRSLLHSILDSMESNSSTRAYQLVALCDGESNLVVSLDHSYLRTHSNHRIHSAVLKCVDRLIHTHLLDLLDREMEFLSSINEHDDLKKAQLNQFFGEHTEFPTLMDTVATLQCAERVARDYRFADMSCVGFDGTLDASTSVHRSMYSTPSPAIGGHLLSIDDPVEDDNHAQGWYSGRGSPSPPPPSLQSTGDACPHQTYHRQDFSSSKHGRSNIYCPSRSSKDSSLFRLIVTLQLCLVRIEEADSVLCNGKAQAATRCADRSRSGSFQSKTSGFGCSSRSVGIHMSTSNDSETSQDMCQSSEHKDKSSWKKSNMLALAGVTAGGALVLTLKSRRACNEQYNILKLAGRAAVGAATASYIRRRWRIFCIDARIADSGAKTEDWILNWICLVNNNGSDVDAGYKQLVLPRKSVLWYSNGRIRFQLMKRGMNLLYASIGKALEITKGREISESPASESKSSGLWIYVVASLAASYYSCIGPAAASASALANSPSSVIQNAWGMVSFPAVKKASLEATRILKGAAIADRVEICGVSCFVLSQEPFPALSSALRRFHRRQERVDVRLSTIHESASQRPMANLKGYSKRNVILHLTGGGFFAHTIAGDLPYLLDWSSSSKAVVIVPEYSLSPKKYPEAITEVISIYRALRFGQAAVLLGFQSDRIIVSGESVGGNLATALCVSLIMDNEEDQCVELTHQKSAEMVSDLEDSLSYNENEDQNTSECGCESKYADIPDALLLCCPALNLSLDSTPSRIDGANDPVLPSALISTISASYLGGCPPTDPIASPYYASDSILCSFPPTLIFTSSEDPLLDDSVSFNGRLRSVGVLSRLRAVHDLPHAFWALSTAGIPEARQVQKECQHWISKVLSSSA